MARTFTALGAPRMLSAVSTSRYDAGVKAFSVHFRWYPTSNPASDQQLFSYQDGTGVMGFYIRNPATTMFPELNINFSTSSAHNAVFTAVGLNTWTSLVFTCSDVTNINCSILAYANGVADPGGGPIAGVGTRSIANAKMCIGSDPGGTQGTGGNLEAIGLWKRIITAAEIAGLSRGNSPDYYPNGLIGHFPLDKAGNEVDTVTGLVCEQTGGTPALVRGIYPTRAPKRMLAANTIVAAGAGYPAMAFFGIPNQMPQPTVRAY